MKVGIIVYSQTGNTASVAKELMEKLEGEGHEVALEEVKVSKAEKGKPEDFKLCNAPLIDDYDMIIFGSPVHGFNLALEMKSYLAQLPTAEGKKALCFITHRMFAANRSVKQMADLCKEKGITVDETGIITWSEKKRESMKEKLLNSFVSKFSA